MYLLLLLLVCGLFFVLWAVTDNEYWMLVCMLVMAVMVTCAESLL